MIPPPIVEWFVWSKLNTHSSPELILLKGHLLVELFLNERLIDHHSHVKETVNNLSFYRKLVLLEQESMNSDKSQNLAVQLAKELNSLRNRLAHEAHFENNITELHHWASKAIQALPSNKMQRSTPKTRLTHAIAALARIIHTPHQTK